MKIYFNSSFVEKNRVVDDSWVKGNNGNVLEAYFESIDLSNPSINFRLVIEWSNGSTTNELIMRKALDSSYAYLTLPPLLFAGETKFTIRLYIADNLEQTTIFTRKIYDSVNASDDTISNTQYQELLNTFDTYDVDIFNLGRRVDSVENKNSQQETIIFTLINDVNTNKQTITSNTSRITSNETEINDLKDSLDDNVNNLQNLINSNSSKIENIETTYATKADISSAYKASGSFEDIESFELWVENKINDNVEIEIGTVVNIVNEFVAQNSNLITFRNEIVGKEMPLGTNLVYTEEGWDSLSGFVDLSEINNRIDTLYDMLKPLDNILTESPYADYGKVDEMILNE